MADVIVIRTAMPSAATGNGRDYGDPVQGYVQEAQDPTAEPDANCTADGHPDDCHNESLQHKGQKHFASGES
jgi:hypothetical protein